MSEVKLNVYDVTTAENNSTNSAICTINNITHSIGLGGVFHGGIEINGEEWSFGHCESGSGVYSCLPCKNSLYTYRESVSLGKTKKTRAEIMNILCHLKYDWMGMSYDLLQRNCCNFCETFAKELEVNAVPGWLNRFASGADAAINFSDRVMNQFSCLTSGIQHSSRASIAWMKDSFRNIKSSQSMSAVKKNSFLKRGIKKGSSEIHMMDAQSAIQNSH